MNYGTHFWKFDFQIYGDFFLNFKLVLRAHCTDLTTWLTILLTIWLTTDT